MFALDQIYKKEEIKNIKMLTTAIGLVAVLVVGLAMPGVTQQNLLITRKGITSAVSNALLQTLFTAASEVLLDLERVSLLSEQL